MAVALNARVGGQSVLVGMDKVVHNLGAETVSEVQNMKIHP